MRVYIPLIVHRNLDEHHGELPLLLGAGLDVVRAFAGGGVGEPGVGVLFMSLQGIA